MTDVKIRKVKCPSEKCCHYIVIDTCDNIPERASEEERYLLSVRFNSADNYNEGEYLPFDELEVIEDLDIDEFDEFFPLNAQEYMLVDFALKKCGYKFNKKTGEIINLKKKRDEEWA